MSIVIDWMLACSHGFFEFLEHDGDDILLQLLCRLLSPLFSPGISCLATHFFRLLSRLRLFLSKPLDLLDSVLKLVNLSLAFGVFRLKLLFFLLSLVLLFLLKLFVLRKLFFHFGDQIVDVLLHSRRFVGAFL